MGSGILGTNVLSGHGFFGFDPTPNASVVNTARKGFNTTGNFGLQPDTNYTAPKVLGASTTSTTQPTTPTTPTGENPPSLDGNSSSGGSATYDPAAVLQYDQGIDQGNQALGRFDGQLNTGLSNIDGQYNQGYNTLLGQKATVDRDYGTNKTNQLQDYQTARDGVATNTRGLLLNARRLLGSNGAGGGSADRYAAPNAAQTEGNNQNAVVQKTNARNLAALDTTYDDNTRKLDSGFNDLATQRDSGVRSLKSQFEQQRADVLNTIAQLTGQKAIANGQTLEQARAAASPFTSRIQGILGNIDALAANPAVIKAQQVNLGTPDLAQYTYDRFNAPTAAAQDTSMTPNIAALLGYNSDQKQQQLI